jgi:hypothetical protein
MPVLVSDGSAELRAMICQHRRAGEAAEDSWDLNVEGKGGASSEVRSMEGR